MALVNEFSTHRRPSFFKRTTSDRKRLSGLIKAPWPKKLLKPILKGGCASPSDRKLRMKAIRLGADETAPVLQKWLDLAMGEEILPEQKDHLILYLNPAHRAYHRVKDFVERLGLEETRMSSAHAYYLPEQDKKIFTRNRKIHSDSYFIMPSLSGTPATGTLMRC